MRARASFRTDIIRLLDTEMVRSWVWSYADRTGDYAVCKLCDSPASYNKYYCAGGSTGATGNHLKRIHNIIPGSGEERRGEKRR